MELQTFFIIFPIYWQISVTVYTGYLGAYRLHALTSLPPHNADYCGQKGTSRSAAHNRYTGSEISGKKRDKTAKLPVASSLYKTITRWSSVKSFQQLSTLQTALNLQDTYDRYDWRQRVVNWSVALMKIIRCDDEA